MDQFHLHSNENSVLSMDFNSILYALEYKMKIKLPPRYCVTVYFSDYYYYHLFIIIPVIYLNCIRPDLYASISSHSFKIHSIKRFSFGKYHLVPTVSMSSIQTQINAECTIIFIVQRANKN